MNVRDEIRLHADVADKPVLNWLFGRYHWASQWSFVAKCTFVKYGTQSYQAKRVWTPTEEGRVRRTYARAVTGQNEARSRSCNAVERMDATDPRRTV